MCLTAGYENVGSSLYPFMYIDRVDLDVIGLFRLRYRFKWELLQLVLSLVYAQLRHGTVTELE